MRLLLPFLLLTLTTPAPSQQPAASPSPAPIERRDPSLDLAANLIGQALFLRCSCAEDNLTFTISGTPDLKGKLKTVDWTLAGVNVTKTTRRSPSEIELEGVRVAVRFAPDRREWDRHPQKTESMRISLQDTGDPAAFRRELAAVFSVGIDRALQRSMPPLWQHYFDPGMPWPPDDLAGVTLYVPGKPDASGKTATAPTEQHKAQPSYTAAAQRDRVAGTTLLQLVVDATGAPRRIAVKEPLGYGLDAEAADAAAKLRFQPAEFDGRPVASVLYIRQDFTIVPVPR